MSAAAARAGALSAASTRWAWHGGGALVKLRPSRRRGALWEAEGNMADGEEP